MFCMSLFNMHFNVSSINVKEKKINLEICARTSSSCYIEDCHTTELLDYQSDP